MIETFNLLTREIKEHDNIVIMAHKGMDLDAYGASLCLYEIVKSFEKNVMIYMSRIPENNSIEKSIKKGHAVRRALHTLHHNSKIILHRIILLICSDNHICLLLLLQI